MTTTAWLGLGGFYLTVVIFGVVVWIAIKMGA